MYRIRDRGPLTSLRPHCIIRNDMPYASTPASRPGPIVRRLVDEQGRKYAWVADQLGVSRQLLGRIVAGERDLTIGEAQRLARILGVPVTTFFEADR